MSAPRVVVVVKRTLYERFVEEENDPRVRKLIRQNDPSVSRWRLAHREHQATLAEVEASLDRLHARVWVVHGPRVVFDASDAALVVTVGGDGTLLAASHHVGAVPILGVNSSPGSSVGFFCGARRADIGKMLERALASDLPSVRLSRMRVAVNGRIVSKRVLNEALFSHAIPAAASRYILRYGRRVEEQVSSGFWVGTAAGSTGAMHSTGGKILPLGSKRLELVVREPLARSRYRMTRVFVEPGREITAHNKMHDACLFLDGPYRKVTVRLGDQVSFSASEEPVRVLGLTSRRGRR
jgi:NAD+ kinase